MRGETGVTLVLDTYESHECVAIVFLPPAPAIVVVAVVATIRIAKLLAHAHSGIHGSKFQAVFSLGVCLCKLCDPFVPRLKFVVDRVVFGLFTLAGLSPTGS
jgi:hypothetical protein